MNELHLSAIQKLTNMQENRTSPSKTKNEEPDDLHHNSLFYFSPKKNKIKKKFSTGLRRRHSVSININNSLLMKKQELFGPKKFVDLNIVKNLDKKNKKYMEQLYVLNINNKCRDSNEKEIAVTFLIKNQLREVVANDLDFFHINLKKYINYILDYITIKQYGYLDIIYYGKEIPKEFYFILNDSTVGEYDFEIYEQSMNFEDYLLYLNKLSILYEKFNERKNFINSNSNNHDDNNSFIDSYLIRKIVEENNKVYPILSYYDIKDAKEIIIKKKIYDLIIKREEEEKKKENEENPVNNDYDKNDEDENKYKIIEEEILEIHRKYSADLQILNYDEVIQGEISYEKYFNSFKNSVLTDDSIQHYLKLLENQNENIIKKIKYKNIKTYKKYDYFGYFEKFSKNKTTTRREVTARSETNSTLLLCFNKSQYFNVISSIMKEENQKNILYFHEAYIFKDVNLEYFTKKIFTEFELSYNFKGDILFNQNQKNRKLILLKDGVIEMQIQNISLNELSEKLLSIKELLIEKIKEYKITQNRIIDKISDLSMDTRSPLQKHIIKQLMNEKLNIIFSRSNKGFFGEYECFFNIPSLLTGVVVSENSEEYIYPYKKFTELNLHSVTLNEKLKMYSFNKLVNILKRMFTIYNSYWRILNNKYSNMIKDENNGDNNDIKLIINEDNKCNLNINDNNYIQTDNNNRQKYCIIDSYCNSFKKKIYRPDNIRLKISTPKMSQRLYCVKLKEIINNNMETIKHEKTLKNNKISHSLNKPKKKLKIRQWDFSFNPKIYNTVNNSKRFSLNFNNVSLSKKTRNNKTLDLAKSSIISNNLLKTKLNEANKIMIKKDKKIDKKFIKNVILPPILRSNEKSTNLFDTSKYSSSKDQSKNVDQYFNNEYRHKTEGNYIITDLNDEIRNKKTNNFDIKRASINYLKSRKNKYLTNNESIISWGEYYYTNDL